MEVNYYKEKNCLVVVPSGKLDTINAPKFGKTLSNLLDEKPQSCFLDLSEVSFLSSSGLQVLLAGAKVSKKENIDFAIFGMNEMVNDVFHLSGFNNFIKIYDTKKDTLT